MMKAIVVHSFGGPDVMTYEDAPMPAPGKGEVLIRVYAAGVNPSDGITRSGYETVPAKIRPSIRPSLPMIPGWDVSGVVAAVGESTRIFKVGDAVYGLVSFPQQGPAGAYAEYMVAPEEHLARKPDAIDYLHAAALPMAVLTAWQALDKADIHAGHRVLVNGASGGVGHMAIQLAKIRGATVIGTASGKNELFVKQFEVDQFIDYTQSRLTDIDAPVDVVIDTVGGENGEQLLDLIKPGGKLVPIFYSPYSAEKGLWLVFVAAGAAVYVKRSRRS
ncbi:NADPH:quinone reductase [Cohnella sp. OV330]|uniref:NADP-dependent oxidoreductase n=1 Tax=Cohnella sp. OV330 TaxID=1855288 RepID=UPI0008E6B5B0|nr:NADP-dependent oxidoreductase [Cohnella sp. OV330]SFB58196.1 NADPH:quinone reductase [Cohnella sp. OV330]